MREGLYATSRVGPAGAVPALKGVPLFAGLTPQQLRRVAAVGRVKLFRAGTAIVHLGEPGDTFYVILDGHALVVRETGRPLKLHTGDFFGELALIENAPRSADVIATGDVTALTIGRTAFKKLLRSRGRVHARDPPHRRRAVAHRPARTALVVDNLPS